jgi:hypothetical protein
MLQRMMNSLKNLSFRSQLGFGITYFTGDLGFRT